MRVKAMNVKDNDNEEIMMVKELNSDIELGKE